jgi:hypothetical protein
MVSDLIAPELGLHATRGTRMPTLTNGRSACAPAALAKMTAAPPAARFRSCSTWLERTARESQSLESKVDGRKSKAAAQTQPSNLDLDLRPSTFDSTSDPHD